MKPMPKTPRRQQRGLSLSELIIAMAIGIFMTGVIASFYLNMRGSFRYQEDVGRLQESGRFALDMLARDIRMAGYNGCGDIANMANLVNGGGNIMFDFTTPIIGYEAGYPAEMVNVIAGTDAFVIKGVDSSDELVVQSHNASAATIHTSEHKILAGSILLITDCSHAAIFQMTGPNSGGTKSTIVHNKGTGTPGNCEKELGATCPTQKPYEFKPGSSVVKIYANGYYIAPASSGNGNSLWRVALDQDDTAGTTATINQEMIEGIESMLVSYGMDTNNDRVADLFKRASTIAAADWDQVVSVRIALLARGSKAKQTVGNQTLIFDRDLSTTPTSTTYTDGFVRKVFAETIALRNRTP